MESWGAWIAAGPFRWQLIGGLAFAAVGMLLLWTVGKVPVHYNLRNLIVRWKTTSLTALAFTLVVSLLTVMLAFVNGMYRLTQNSGQPTNVLVLSDGATDEVFSNLGFADLSDIERQPGVARTAEGTPLCSKEVYVIVNQPVPVPEGSPSRRRFVQVRGLDDPVLGGQVHGVNLLPGGVWFSPAGVEPTPPGTRGAAALPLVQAVLGIGIATELGKDRPGGAPLQAGDTFSLGPRQWKVTGVLEPGGSTFDSEVWAKRALIGPMFGKLAYSTLVLRSTDGPAAQKLATFLDQDYTQAAVKAYWEPQYFSQLGQTSQQFLYAIVFVACVMAVGGVFGVMNTMFAAISQRTRDIGTLRILGFRRREVLVSFLLESLVIALIGGLLGCALGWLADGWSAKSIVSGGPGTGAKFVVLKLIVDTDILAAGLLLSLVMGFVGGLVPALSAMRLRALDSLR